MKATEQYFPVVLFIMLYKVVLTFKSLDEIVKCDYSDESFWELCILFLILIRKLNFSVKKGKHFR